MVAAKGRCPCGCRREYRDPFARAFVERLVEQLGPNIKVRCGGKTYLVPRHYIALHGLKGLELPALGFPEVAQ